MSTLPTVRSRYETSLIGVGQPDWRATAFASGSARSTTAASSAEISGRLAITRTCSSARSPTEIGERRTWNALVPIIAPVRFSLTYAFIPWMTATTTTRKPTETMMPRRVKKDRSLAPQMAWSARRRASRKGMGGR